MLGGLEIGFPHKAPSIKYTAVPQRTALALARWAGAVNSSNRPLKLSSVPFCQGLPGSTNADHRQALERPAVCERVEPEVDGPNVIRAIRWSGARSSSRYALAR